jgi:hypothetical protein
MRAAFQLSSGDSYYFLNSCPTHGGVYPSNYYSNNLNFTISSYDNSQVTGQEVIKTRLTIQIAGYGSTTLNPLCTNTSGTFGFLDIWF